MAKIMIVGDLSVDWLQYPVAAVDATTESNISNWRLYPGTRMMARPGGALLIAGFLKASDHTLLTHRIGTLETIPPDRAIHSLAELEAFPSSTKKEDVKNLVYRVKTLRGFCGPSIGNPDPWELENNDPSVDILVVDDAGNGYRNFEQSWPQALKKPENDPVIIYKNHRPLATGELWNQLQIHAQRLVVVVSADDLRAEPHGLNISRRLSWERTAKDFVWQTACNAHLMTLAACANLIVRFGIDGAIHYVRRGGQVSAQLYYDPLRAEDGFYDECPGKMVGLTSAFVAGLTLKIAEQGLAGIGAGIREGIAASRRLLLSGFGPVAQDREPDYQLAELFIPAEREGTVADVAIPQPSSNESPDPESWCILKDIGQFSLEDTAEQIVFHGENRALRNVPVGKFGDLKTVDRSEIESFRSIQNILGEYVKKLDVTRPLSIAVFGPPGAGKSFGVTQVAESIAKDKIKKIEFNVAQFRAQQDLVSALHKVRDMALEGIIPLVFFDEFDSVFEGHLGWLKYFLAPMQDGKFRDGESMHPVGKAIFVFAGGTAKTLDVFSGRDLTGSKAKLFEEQFRKSKGPDFISRLRGYVDILGPNPVHEQDFFYMIRRAMLLRSMLERSSYRNKLFDRTGKMRIDRGVLRAFLKVPVYEHGTRSLECIIDMSTLRGRKSYEQAALPPFQQLQLHVDADAFMKLVARDVLFVAARETLARQIHESFRKIKKAGKPKNDPALRPWSRLPENYKKSSRKQADDMTQKLQAIRCSFHVSRKKSIHKIQFTPAEIEILAKLEHERFVRERLLDGWSLGPVKDSDKKISPYLVPWDELTQKIQDIDRKMMRQIPDFMAKAGFEIYRIE